MWGKIGAEERIRWSDLLAWRQITVVAVGREKKIQAAKESGGWVFVEEDKTRTGEEKVESLKKKTERYD